jgi:hypothetical protein
MDDMWTFKFVPLEGSRSNSGFPPEIRRRMQPVPPFEPVRKIALKAPRGSGRGP